MGARRIPGPGSTLLLALGALGCGRTLVVGTDVPPEAPASLLDGLNAYWRLDDGPNVDLVVDSSGRHHDTYPQSISPSDWLAEGHIRGALKFGMAGWLRGADETGPIVDLIGDAGLSMAFWIRIDDHEDRQQILVQRQAGTGTDAHFRLDLTSDRPALSGIALPRCEAPALATGVWVHLAATFDGATERLFFDGREVATCPAAGSHIASDTTVVMVGAAQISAARFDTDVATRLRAQLDELGLWSRALTTPEIQALAAGQVPKLP